MYTFVPFPIFFSHLHDTITEVIITQTVTEAKLNAGHLNITTDCSTGHTSRKLIYVCLKSKTNTLYISALFGNKQSFSLFQKEAESKMESKGNRGNSHVLMFGLSFNLILTLGSLFFTCYSLHQLDSRLTAVEQSSLLTKPTYQLANRVIVEPTSRHPRPSGSQMKETVRVKRAAERPTSMCRRCNSVCLNSKGLRSVSQILLTFMFYKCP